MAIHSFPGQELGKKERRNSLPLLVEQTNQSLLILEQTKLSFRISKSQPFFAFHSPPTRVDLKLEER